MKTKPILVALLAWSVALPAQAADQAIPGSLLSLYEAVLAHHLQASPADGKFSLALHLDAKARRVVPLPKEAEARILKTSGVDASRYVSAGDLRLPEPGERDPKDKTGQTARGIEVVKSGERVHILYIAGVRLLGVDQVEVYYGSYSGPLAAAGGSYIVKFTAAGIDIQPSPSGWTS